MTIVISIYSLAVGGAQTFVIRLANALSKDHKVFLYIQEPSRTQKELLDRISSDVTVVYFSLSRVSEWFSWKINRLISLFVDGFSFQRYLNRQYFSYFLKKTQPDILNSHMLSSDLIVTDIDHSVPLVLSMHGCYENHLRIDPKFSDRASVILSKAKSVVYVAKKNLEIFSLIAPLSQSVPKKLIYYGIEDTKEIDGASTLPTKLIFGMIARSIPSKGWEQSLLAFTQLLSNHPGENMEFWVICDESDYLEDLKLKFAHPSIKYIGFASNPDQFISQMDVCLLPTYFPGESLPNSIIEYLKAGKPVSASDTAEIPNMLSIGSQIAGMLVPCRDFVEYADVLRCMEMYAQDRSLIIRHGELAREAFKKFSIDDCTRAYVEVFKNAIGRA